MALMTALSLSLHSQDDEMLRHLSLSAGLGTTGITVDVGTGLGKNVSVRGGIDFMPKFRHTTGLKLALVNQTKEIDISKVPERKVDVTGTLHNTTGHVLLEIYPSSEHGFHVTLGAYFARSRKVVDVINKESDLLKMVADLNARRGEFATIPISYGQVAAKMGDYNIMPDDDGNASANIQVRKVRPYLGVGFGRAVPSRSRLQCLFDLGVQFSGKLHVYNGVTGEELIAEKIHGEDGGILRTISKIYFYPVLSFRLVGRIF